MIRMGMRLTLRGGREAVIRLVVTSLAVAVGVAVMLGFKGVKLDEHGDPQ